MFVILPSYAGEGEEGAEPLGFMGLNILNLTPPWVPKTKGEFLPLNFSVSWLHRHCKVPKRK